MKINRYLSKKNKIATGLTAVLIGTTIIGSGIALSGYSSNTKDTAVIATVDETEPEKEVITAEQVINNLGLPSFITKNKDIYNNIIAVVNEQNQDSNIIEYIKDSEVIYTTDKRIFYNKKHRILEFSTNIKNINILNKYTLYDKKEFSADKIYKTKSQKSLYDENGKNLSFNKINSEGISHSYNEKPLYVFDESITYCSDYNAINKTLIYYKGNSNSFSGRYNYTTIDHAKNKKLNFAYLRKEVSNLTKNQVTTYSKDEKEIKEFIDAFDKRKFDILKANLLKKEEQSTTTPKKK